VERQKETDFSAFTLAVLTIVVSTGLFVALFL
jgi:hypothetical protein